MTPLSFLTSQQASPSPGSIRPHKAIHLHFPRTALRSAARVAPPLLHSADAGSVQALAPRVKKSRKRCEERRKPLQTPLCCAHRPASASSSELHTDSRQLTSPAPPPRSSSHMSVVQGTECAVHALLWVSPISTCRWAAEIIHGIPNLTACDGSPVVVSARCPLGSTRKDLTDPVDVSLTSWCAVDLLSAKRSLSIDLASVVAVSRMQPPNASLELIAHERRASYKGTEYQQRGVTHPCLRILPAACTCSSSCRPAPIA
jgi:hypothetical protein